MMPTPRTPFFRTRARRAAALALVALPALLGAAATPAAAATQDQACRYSYDQYWRNVPVISSGTLTDVTGSPAETVPGDTLQLTGGQITADLPEWILPFGVEAGLIPTGTGEIPIDVWVAIEATNAVPDGASQTATTRVSGTRFIQAVSTVADTQVELDPSTGQVTPTSTITVRPAALQPMAFTATGGDVAVRQALGNALEPLPVGRGGALVKPEGSMYVRAQIGTGGESVNLYLDCMPGEAQQNGATHSDALPAPFAAAVQVPGWTGTLTGSGSVGTVNADLSTTSAPARGATGTTATIEGASLVLRANGTQLDSWVPTGENVTATLQLIGDGSTEGSRTVTFTAPATRNGTTITVPVPNTSWTRGGVGDVAVRLDPAAPIVANSGLTELTLSRTAPALPTVAFNRVLPPVQPISTDTGAGQAPPAPAPQLPPTRPIAAPPAVTAKRAVAKVTTKSVRVDSKGRVSIKLTNPGASAVKITVAAKTKGKVKLAGSKKAKVQTLAASRSVTLKAKGTTTVRLTVKRKLRTLIKQRKKLTVAITVTPRTTSSVLQKATRTVTVKR